MAVIYITSTSPCFSISSLCPRDGIHMAPLVDSAGTSFSVSAYVEELSATHDWAKSGKNIMFVAPSVSFQPQ
jgi:hypothetical protein